MKSNQILRFPGHLTYVLLLSVYNSGARASDTRASVRIFGKGEKIQRCPLWDKPRCALESSSTRSETKLRLF